MEPPSPGRSSGLTPRAAEILGAARALLEEEGADGLTMRSIGARLGIRAPALYKHFSDKGAIVVRLIEEGMRETGDRMLAAMEGAEDPLAVLVLEHRAWALEHPGLYRLSFGEDLDRDRIDPAAETHAGMPIFLATGGDADLSRVVWAFVHGMIDLELLERFPDGTDVDAVWRLGLDGLRALAERRA